MAQLEWNRSLSVGIATIDEQHKHLIELVNEFLEAADAGEGPAAIHGVVERLRKYTVSHFHDEEQFMEQIKYPDRGAHQVAHKELVRTVKLFQRDIYTQQGVSVAAMRSFLKQWLINHILEKDVALGKWHRAELARTTQAVRSGAPKDTTAKTK